MEGNPLETINWAAVLVASVSMFALGAVWYGPLFGKAWSRATGITEEKAREANMARTFGVAFVLTLLAAVALAMFIGAEPTLAFGVFAGFMTGAFFVATALGLTFLFEQRPFRLWAIDAGYHVVGFTLMGAILGAW